MIERVEKLDLKKGELVAARTFSQVTDQWLPDHKPFQSLKHPLVSGIMAVETFLEAARLLYPHLRVLGMRRLKFEDILEVPPGTGREARVLCRREEEATQEVRCHVELSSVGLSPSDVPWTHGPRTTGDRLFSGREPYPCPSRRISP